MRNATTGATQNYKISIAIDDKPSSVQQESWKDIALAAVNVLHQSANVALHSLKSADIYPYQQRLKYQQTGPGTVEEDKVFDDSQKHFAKLAETIQKVESVSRQPFQTLGTLPLRTQAESPPHPIPAPSPSAAGDTGRAQTQSMHPARTPAQHPPLSASGLTARVEPQPQPAPQPTPAGKPPERTPQTAPAATPLPLPASLHASKITIQAAPQKEPERKAVAAVADPILQPATRSQPAGAPAPAASPPPASAAQPSIKATPTQSEGSRITRLFSSLASLNPFGGSPVATPTREDDRPSTKQPIFVDEKGLSQHHSDFRTSEYQLGASKDGEPVYFGTAACTPLAISFALSAKTPQEQTDRSTPSKILNIIMGDKDCLRKGKDEIGRMIQADAHKPEDDKEVALDRMNLNTTNGLRLYNAMKGTKHESTRSYYLSPLTSQRMTCVSKDGASEVMTWDQQFLQDDLKNGEGAVIIFGGYSIGVRRIGDIYEIFDSHSSEAHTGQSGCCVVQCRTREELAKYLNKIRDTGPAVIAQQLGQEELDQYIQLQPAAFGVEILVF